MEVERQGKMLHIAEALQLAVDTCALERRRATQRHRRRYTTRTDRPVRPQDVAREIARSVTADRPDA
jgi:hypothetical protein